jgi:hypothetical protein
MKLFAAALSGLAILAAAPAAHASGYISLAIGEGARLSGDVATGFTNNNTSSGRIAIGQRHGSFAIEGSIYGTTLAVGESAEVPQYSTTSVAVDVKYLQPLSGRLEGYIRGGIHHTRLSPEDDRMSDVAAGNSWSVGAGLQYGFRLPMAGAAVFLDYNHQELDLRDDAGRAIGGSAKMLMVGLAVGTNL